MHNSGNYQQHTKFVKELYAVPQALTHKRTYDNFAKSNVDPEWKLPPPFGVERWSASLERSTLFPYLFFSDGDGMKPVIMAALALGLFSGALSTFLYLYMTWETYVQDPTAYSLGNPATFDGSTSDLVDRTGKKISSLVTAFKFFPSFLALGYVGYAIDRWRSFQNICYSIQGALCNTALIVGGSLTEPHGEACKQLAFRIYRYLQLVHLLAYLKRNAWYKLLTMTDFVELGLLTNEELKLLLPADNKKHEVVISWIVVTIQAGMREGLLKDSEKVLEDACSIRGKLGSFNHHFALGEPNLWTALMKLVCDLLIMMFVIGAAFDSFLYQLGSFQTYVVLFSIFLAVPWLCAQRLVTLLENPFDSYHDMFNTDALVANTERTIFLNLRCGWHGNFQSLSEAGAPCSQGVAISNSTLKCVETPVQNGPDWMQHTLPDSTNSGLAAASLNSPLQPPSLSNQRFSV